MYRKIEEDLKKWKNDFKMPLMLIGARQTGKTYILEDFCKNNFENSFDNIPSLDDVKAYALERGSAVDCEKFYDHYSAVGWMMGKTPLKD